jgi:multiple antibiotic resistance protein
MNLPSIDFGFLGFFIASFISIISVANPLSTMPVFTSLTQGDTNKERAQIAKKTAFYMVLILTLFLLAGSYIKSFFGISMAGIRVAGGLIILRSAWTMLSPNEEEISDEDKELAKAKEDISFSPLALPLMSGPGSISVVIGLTSGTKEILNYVAILAAIILTTFVSYFMLRLGPLASKYIGHNGMNAMSRLMGFIVMAIAVEFILSGIHDFFMI